MEHAKVFVGTLRDLLGMVTGERTENGTRGELSPHAAMSLTKALVADVIDRAIQTGPEHVGCALFGSHGSGQIKAQTACTGDGSLETLMYTPQGDEHGATHRLVVSLRRVPMVAEAEEDVSTDDVDSAIERVSLSLETATRAADAMSSPLLANLPHEMGAQLAEEMETSILVLRCLKRMRATMDSQAK